jgi:hypothetical protein
VVGDERRGLFVMLLVNVVCVELRVQLMVVGGEGKKEEGSEGSSGGLSESIAVCFAIIEQALACLLMDDDEAGEGDSWATLEGDIVLSFQKRLTEIFGDVFLFLQDMREREEKRERGVDGALVMACVRACAGWVAEDTEALQSEYRELLPYLLSLPAWEGVDPLLFLAPSLIG